MRLLPVDMGVGVAVVAMLLGEVGGREGHCKGNEFSLSPATSVERENRSLYGK